MLDSLQNKVVKLIPSESLRNEIEKTGYKCSEITLLSTIFYYAPSFDSRMELLQFAYDSFEGELKEFTVQLMEWQQKIRDEFIKNEPSVVFELHIRETPDVPDETYLCSSFDAAMKTICQYYQELECDESDSARYNIIKHHIYSMDTDAKLSDDPLGEAVLLSGRILYSVEMFGHRQEDCSDSCVECTKPLCVYNLEEEAQYPCFINDKELVEYRERDGRKRYGIVHTNDNSAGNLQYVIPLDCEWMRNHEFDDVWYAHSHVPAPLIEKISPEILSEKMREYYFAYLKYLDANH